MDIWAFLSSVAYNDYLSEQYDTYQSTKTTLRMSLSSYLLKELERLILLQLDTRSLFRYSIVSREAYDSCNSRTFWYSYIRRLNKHGRFRLISGVLLGQSLYSEKLYGEFLYYADYSEKERLLFEYRLQRLANNRVSLLYPTIYYELQLFDEPQGEYKHQAATLDRTEDICIYYSTLDKSYSAYNALLNLCYRTRDGSFEEAENSFIVECGDDILCLNKEVIADVVCVTFSTNWQNLHLIFDSDRLLLETPFAWEHLTEAILRRLGETWTNNSSQQLNPDDRDAGRDFNSTVAISQLLSYYYNAWKTSQPVGAQMLEMIISYLPKEAIDLARTRMDHLNNFPMSPEPPREAERFKEAIKTVNIDYSDYLALTILSERTVSIYAHDNEQLMEIIDYLSINQSVKIARRIIRVLMMECLSYKATRTINTLLTRYIG